MDSMKDMCLFNLGLVLCADLFGGGQDVMIGIFGFFFFAFPFSFLYDGFPFSLFLTCFLQCYIEVNLLLIRLSMTKDFLYSLSFHFLNSNFSFHQFSVL